MLADRLLTPLFDAVIDATEAAILNALLAGTTMRGYRATVYALTAEALVEAVTRLGRPPAKRT
jgi:D-aminopeptidase